MVEFIMKRLYLFLCVNAIRLIDWSLDDDTVPQSERYELLLIRRHITDDLLRHGILIC